MQNLTVERAPESLRRPDVCTYAHLQAQSAVAYTHAALRVPYPKGAWASGPCLRFPLLAPVFRTGLMQLPLTSQ